jgi:alpha-L-rhamnosidase
MKKIFSIILFIFLSNYGIAQKVDIENIFKHPPQSAKPWVFWYWLHGAVSKEGITADLEAMKEVGIGGAYLMPIKDTNSKIPFQPQARQLTPQWWTLVKFALQEAKRLQLQIGVHVSDGFALAGGPWIKPEMSMQKLTWSKVFIKAGDKNQIILPQPETKENYYKDIAVYAYPANYKNEIARNNLNPVVTTSNGSDASFLSDATAKQTFRSDSNCWIQYTFPQSITLRQVKIKKQNNAYQSQRFIIQQSSDGINFTAVDTLQPPRHGWQDWEEGYTHAIKTFSSRYIRFVCQKEGTEPGSEDLDAAKWKPVLRVQGIYVSDEPVINNYEAKNGSVWRIAGNTTNEEVSKADAVPMKSIINLTKYLQNDGSLKWKAPSNTNWVIVRIGHTSTGAVNSTAGGGKGLECDKFSTEATTLQFNNWFAKFYTETDAAVAKEVIKVLHVDSWECGSQNWSKNFATEFKKKRGYDLLPYLLVMTGIPVTDVATSEKILHDVRQTIAELVNDKFYGTLKILAHAKDLQISAESIAPTFVSDGLLHYKNVDIPMGEFWLNSPTHDKPNDMLDAISAAHIYGKNIVGAEAFTTLRSDWSEHPGNLKALGDRAFASGINKFSLHVMMHSPWLDKKPGMTLDGIGLFYQRDQTWFKQSKAWIAYLTRCQALLQLGKPVVDIGVFTGEEIPSRSVLPDRLISTLPGLFGQEKVAAEKKRLQNEGQPQRTIPDGVTHSANMADPENYVDALNGYKYDCFNLDVLMQMKVVNGRVVTPGEASYGVLVIPGKHSMNPNAVMSDEVKNKLKQLAGAGAKIIIDTAYWKIDDVNKKFISSPYNATNLEKFCGERDVVIYNNGHRINWTHRKTDSTDIYFLCNQTAEEIHTNVRFGVQNKIAETVSFFDGKIYRYINSGGNTYSDFGNKRPINIISIELKPYESKFFIFRIPAMEQSFYFETKGNEKEIFFNDKWKLKIKNQDTVTLNKLISLHQMKDSGFKHYSGSVFYTNTFKLDKTQVNSNPLIQFNYIYNIATVIVNGVNCGTLWTPPFTLDISKAIKPGINKIEIEVTNTWRNRLIGDELMPEKRQTWLNSPYKLKDKPLLPAGIVGDVKILIR